MGEMMKRRRCRVLCRVGSLAMFPLVLATLFPAPGKAAGTPPPPIGVEVKQTHHCSALAPRDWAFSSNQQASAADAGSADHTMYAAWGVLAINRQMQPYYGPLYGDPQTSILTVINGTVRQALSDGSGIRYTSSPRPFLNYFALQTIESAQTAGLVFYKIYPGAVPQTHIESFYIAAARKSQSQVRLLIAVGVVVSIRCVTQFQFTPQAAVRPSRTGRPKPPGCGAGGALRGYNRELGMQYAHDSRGSNYFLDPAAQWWDTGPQGPGYYITTSGGNFTEKLELGRDDDC